MLKIELPAVPVTLSQCASERILAELAPVDLLSSSVKTVKGEKYGYATMVMYLSPADYLSQYTGFKFKNLCPHATDGCRAACLGEHSGRMGFDGPKSARIRRTLLYHLSLTQFFAQLVREITKGIAKARKSGQVPVVRLNGSSDVLWERVFPELFAMFPDVQFYDYTKVPLRHRRNLPDNYWLTFSRSGENDADCVEAIDAGHNVAVVFGNGIPATFTIAGREFQVIDGDAHDIRIPSFDGRGVIVGLNAKGAGKKDTSGFVVWN